MFTKENIENKILDIMKNQAIKESTISIQANFEI